MPKATSDKITLEYETIGNPNSKPLLLIAGLGSQLIAWPDDLCNEFAKKVFFVIRFDSRDVGLSTKLGNAGIPDFTKITEAYAKGERPNVPYSLEDMADDAISILNALKIDKAHICGASMGGMIAQVLAYRHPSRVLSLSVISSTTGNPALPQGKPEVLAAFFAPLPSEREAYIEETVRRDQLIYGTYKFDKNRGREYRSREFDRCFYPEGSIRQMAATSVPGNIKPKISAIRAPTVVIHGSEDPFYPVEAAKEIASEIPGARLVILKGMGHVGFPREVIPQIVKAVVENSNRSDH